MKSIYLFLIVLLAFSCNQSTPDEECFTCKTELRIERPNAAIEQTTDTETVCGQAAADQYQRKNSFETRTSTLYTKSTATCSK